MLVRCKQDVLFTHSAIHILPLDRNPTELETKQIRTFKTFKFNMIDILLYYSQSPIKDEIKRTGMFKTFAFDVIDTLRY